MVRPTAAAAVRQPREWRCPEWWLAVSRAAAATRSNARALPRSRRWRRCQAGSPCLCVVLLPHRSHGRVARRAAGGARQGAAARRCRRWSSHPEVGGPRSRPRWIWAGPATRCRRAKSRHGLEMLPTPSQATLPVYRAKSPARDADARCRLRHPRALQTNDDGWKVGELARRVGPNTAR